MPQRTCKLESCARSHCGLGFCEGHLARVRLYGAPDESRPLQKKHTKGAAEDFIRQVVVGWVDPVCCLFWPFRITEAGYGRLTLDGVRMTAHRAVLIMAVGPPPTERHEAAHSPVVCHNRSCVNPFHLRWADRVGNNDDRFADKTNGKVLDDELAFAIYHDARPHRAIAAVAGVSTSCVGMIKRGESWSHVTGHQKRVRPR